MDIETQQIISRLIFLYVKGKLDEGQIAELQLWRNISAKNEALFQKMVSQEHFRESVRRFVKSDEDEFAEWNKIKQRIDGREKLRLWKRMLRYVAVFILPLAIGLVWYLFGNISKTGEPLQVAVILPGKVCATLILPDGTNVDLQNRDTAGRIRALDREVSVSGDTLKYREVDPSGTEVYHILKVPRGGEYSLVLSDGSKVYLNAGSQLRYPVHFTGNSRTVFLEGEAFFEIKRDAAHPFIVDVSHLQVRVLGTTFGVRAYADEDEIFTTLVCGAVNVNANHHQVTLNPDEQAAFDRNTGDLEVKPIDVELFVGWKDGRLIFDNQPLEKILKDLARWYSFDVFYADNRIKDIPFSMNIKKHENFSEVLTLLEKTGKLHCAINNNTVIIK